MGVATTKRSTVMTAIINIGRQSFVCACLALLIALGCHPRAYGQAAGTKHALLIGGLGGSPEYSERFGTYLSDTRSLLVDRYDFPADHVFVLAEQTLADRPFVDDVSTAENIQAYAETLRRMASDDDYVFVILFGHGSYDGSNAQLNIPRQDLADADYASLIDAIDAARLVFINTASASGPFASVLSGSNRIVMTATATGTERDETIFPRYFVEALRNDDSDLDKNGALSVREAFLYASRQVARSYEAAGRIATEHSLLDDDGDGTASRLEAVESGDEGNLAGVTYFRPAQATASVSEAARPLLREKEEVEREIAAVKGRKDELTVAAYYAELESLFIRLARLNEQIENGG